MLTAAGARKLACVEADRRHLNVEIELDAHTLCGTVTGSGEEAQRFDGWLELMGAIEGRRPPASPGEADASAPGAPNGGAPESGAEGERR